MNIVFDAEPLLAFLKGEAQAPAVRDLLDEVASGRLDGYVSAVNMAEVQYVLERDAPRLAADLVKWLVESSLRIVGAGQTWVDAGRIKARHSISLADAFAIATARQVQGDLVVASDPHFKVASALGVALRTV